MPSTPHAGRVALALHVAFSLILFAAFALRETSASYLVLGVAAVYALAQLPRIRRALPAERRILAIWIAGAASLAAVSLPRAGLSVTFHLLIVLATTGAAFGATRNPRTWWRVSQMTLLATQAWVLAYLTTTGLTGFPLEDLIADSSSNGITSYLLVLQVNYCLVHYALRRRFAWLTLLATVFICVVGYGRGSIVASIALLAASLVVSAVSHTARSRAPVVIALVLAAWGGVRYRDDLGVFLEANTKFGVATGDFHRALIIDEYLRELTPATVIVGGTFDRTVINRAYNGNPHNSFIRAHHIFGIGMLLALLALPFAAQPRGWTWAGRGYLLLGFGVLYFRAFTEPILFPTLLDYYFLGMCFTLCAARPDDGALDRQAAPTSIGLPAPLPLGVTA